MVELDLPTIAAEAEAAVEPVDVAAAAAVEIVVAAAELFMNSLLIHPSIFIDRL